MAHIYKEALLTYSAHQVFLVITDIPAYPLFLDWCDEAKIDERTSENVVCATIGINFHGIKQSFQTQNTMIADQSIELSLLKGPFKRLRGLWLLNPIENQSLSGCNVSFDIEYEFSHALLEKAVGPVFEKITNDFVDSFVKRVKDVYGES
ncbi:type II toxin-antitoxin system RatA family toxin [Candidatus Ichthyocystis hellenicum]|uniref:type II toxin-antitoxin system RatA family toxin n=1 Tax=Candidatus Ichthyocystis hellenicum TaxID=1561003 RepID=UPI000B85937D|nr:type II toxin-antitoxin system RatA family toxin [Candidatus Ichthyocystis hellenicum]